MLYVGLKISINELYYETTKIGPQLNEKNIPSKYKLCIKGNIIIIIIIRRNDNQANAILTRLEGVGVEGILIADSEAHNVGCGVTRKQVQVANMVAVPMGAHHVGDLSRGYHVGLQTWPMWVRYTLYIQYLLYLIYIYIYNNLPPPLTRQHGPLVPRCHGVHYHVAVRPGLYQDAGTVRLH